MWKDIPCETSNASRLSYYSIRHTRHYYVQLLDVLKYLIDDVVGKREHLAKASRQARAAGTEFMVGSDNRPPGFSMERPPTSGRILVLGITDFKKGTL
ncbi:hypothetical protein IMZ48_15860 [Candidatus Bathyarchaeota archaeon]|nr:hypothetical protein [Candidatus Bathyarchaeota archaeon]